MFFRAVVLALALVLTTQAQDVHITPRIQPKPEVVPLPNADETIKKNVDLALIPVSVYDDMGRPFLGLQKDHFRLKENGKQVPIKYFSIGDAPCSIGIVFDRSGSMAEKMQAAKEAVATLVQYANPQDEYMMITFADTVEQVTDWTNGTDLMNRLTFTVGKGTTALLDATMLGVKRMQTAHYQRRALIIISDGGDNHSRYTPGEVKNFVEEANVTVYAMGLVILPYPMPPPKPGETVILPEEAGELIRGPELLQGVAEKSGGRLFILLDVKDIQNVAAYISATLRTQYLLGYKPQHMKDDGKFRKIKVELQRLPKGVPRLHVANVPAGIYARPAN